MTGLVYLDIAIGVIFLILVFSLFAGALQEAISAIFNLRAKSVYAGIWRMIGNKTEFDKFWDTPLIDSLKGPTSWWNHKPDAAGNAAKRNPSEVPTEIFTKSVIHRLRDELQEDVKARYKDDVDKLKAELEAVTLGDLPVLARRVVERVREDNASDLAKRVAIVLEGVEAKAEHIEAAINGWYDDTRQRFAGWYTRRTQWILVLIGLVLAVLTNTDPIRYGQELRENDALRKNVVAMAEEVAALDDMEDVLEHFGLDDAPDQGTETEIKAIRENVAGRIQQLTDKLDTIEARAGWSHCGEVAWLPCFLDTINPWSETYQKNYKPLLKRNPVPGWILLALGVMLGSQFWLDLLRRFVSIRSAATGILRLPREREVPETRT